MSWRIGVDTGGTFTDVVAVDEETGQRHVRKTSSTPDDPSRAFSSGIRALLAEIGVEAGEVTFISHGTTVATNAILESKYARMGLLVTEGYREMLEVGRQTVPGDFGDITWWLKPARVVPLELVREAGGRLTYTGDEHTPLDEECIREIAREFRTMGIDAIAVSFIHSYRSPVHEQRARALILEEHPECFVSISSDVIREYREYERTLSTCLNTGLMPLVTGYIEGLEGRLAGDGIDARLYVMKSSGGIIRAQEMAPQPISAVLSGPAAGVVTAAYYGKAAGHPDLITIDIGGTSTDICLIDQGTPHMLTEGRIDVYDIKTPMIDMHTVGAGGGSIAWLAAGRSLRVGPQSAGAVPGPVCYSGGGTEPALTDAHIVLGRVSPYLLGGEITLDVEAARQAIGEQIARPLDMTVEEAAMGILELATSNIAQGINVVSVKRGRDPRDYALMAFGGAGGLNACLVAESLGIKTVIVPPSPGVTSAEGLLSTDVRSDRVVTDVQREDALDVPRLTREFSSVQEQVLGDLDREGFTGDDTSVRAFADMRYAGQAYEVRVPVEVNGHGIDEAGIRGALKAFHRAHDDRYGYEYEGRQPVEIVNIGATGFGLFPRLKTASEIRESATWDQARREVRRGVFRDTGAVDLPIYERSLAPIGEAVPGPAVIEQYDATFVLEPGWTATLDSVGQIIVTHDSQEA
ncbi:Acetophenone carboxylase gamma subunit [Capillimicrobium parvum]|uniref:Acetophenone carboxylase gamma subunit n=1 Tax=Capillimicrobium parvum TaxID=2884022 RepID=A0A9E7C357_9ACTN|nr:Acetophenone carboxylase gamma subunit [Capillimicrobium parvum]